MRGGSLQIAAGDDGIHADTQLVIAGGKIDVTESYEGLEGSSVEIAGGEITLAARDDGVNAAGGKDGSGFGFGGRGGFGSRENLDAGGDWNGFRDFGGNGGDYKILISGGKLTVNAQGDGLDSNGTLTVNGGEILVQGPTNSGNGALDFESEGIINGGSVIAVGAGGMAQNFQENSTQCSILVNTRSTQEAGTEVAIKDAAGTILLSAVAEKSYSSVVFSSPDIQVGETYTVALGEEVCEVEMTSTIYGIGFSMGGFGGKGGFRPGDFDKGNPDMGDFQPGDFDKWNPDMGDFQPGDFDKWNPDMGDFDRGDFDKGRRGNQGDMQRPGERNRSGGDL